MAFGLITIVHENESCSYCRTARPDGFDRLPRHANTLAVWQYESSYKRLARRNRFHLVKLDPSLMRSSHKATVTRPLHASTFTALLFWFRGWSWGTGARRKSSGGVWGLLLAISILLLPNLASLSIQWIREHNPLMCDQWIDQRRKMFHELTATTHKSTGDVQGLSFVGNKSRSRESNVPCTFE